MGDVGGEAAACAAAGVDLVLLERGLTIELSGGGVLCGSATAGWLKPASSAGGAACFSAEVLLRVRRGGVALRGAAVAAASGSAGGSDSSPSCDSRPRRSMLRAVAPERGCGLRAWLRPPSAAGAPERGWTLAVSAHCADTLFVQRDRDRPYEASPCRTRSRMDPCWLTSLLRGRRAPTLIFRHDMLAHRPKRTPQQDLRAARERPTAAPKSASSCVQPPCIAMRGMQSTVVCSTRDLIYKKKTRGTCMAG
jgi:hypothetical protein